jgi:hypothetical protein
MSIVVMMSGVAVKQEMSDLPTKTIVVSANGNDSITSSQLDDESRGDSIELKREGDNGDRDRIGSGFVHQNNKKKSSSPAAQSKQSNPNSSHINKHQHQHQHQHHSNRYYNNSSMPSNMPGNRGIFPPMNRGYGAPPPPYNYPGGNFGPPPPQYHNPHSHLMPPYNNGPGGPYPGPPASMKNNYHPSMPYGAPGPYGMPPQYPPHHGMNPTYHNMNLHSESNSISSKSSMNSKKKRTIEGIHNPSSKLPSAYNFRRSDSNSSSTSTVTTGNIISIETHHTEDSLQLNPKASNRDGRNNNSDGSIFSNDHHKILNHHGEPKHRYHRRDYSGASTASSLSAGGFSLSSYERGKVNINVKLTLIIFYIN